MLRSHRHQNWAFLDRDSTPGAPSCNLKWIPDIFNWKTKQYLWVGGNDLFLRMCLCHIGFAQLNEWRDSVKTMWQPFWSFTKKALFLFPLASHHMITWGGGPLFIFPGWSLEYRYRNPVDTLFKPHYQAISATPFSEKTCESNMRENMLCDWNFLVMKEALEIL